MKQAITKNRFLAFMFSISTLLFGLQNAKAQTDTVFSPTGLTANTTGLNQFTFEVTSTSAINIKRMATAWNTAGNLEVWYRVGGVQHQAGAVPVITTANGWVFVASIPMTSSTTPIVIPYLFSIPVNPGTPVGIYFGGSVRYTGSGTPDVYTDNTVSVSFATGKGYAGGTFPTLGTTPRRIVGWWAYEAAFACTTAVGGTTTASSAVICNNGNVTLNVTGASSGSGVTYQWQNSTDSTTWANILNETNPSLNATPATTTFYRRIISCGALGDTSVPVKVTTIGTPLPGGTYTINSGLPTSGTNYASFNDFFNSVNCGGISGPVILNVFPTAQGYNEQVLIGTIGGTSATNTITINGNGALLTSNVGNAFQRATLSIYGTQHLKIKNLTIQNTHGTIGYAVEMANDSRFVEFDSCEFKIPITNTALASSCFILSNANNNPTTAGLAARDLTIKNSFFEGGYYGLVLNGPTSAPWSSNNVIENNIFRDFYLYGFYIRGQENTLIKGNDLSRSNRTTLSTFYAFYLTSGVEGLQITGNSIHNIADQLPTNTSTNYPIYITGANATAANPCVFSNNLMYNINNNGLTYGAYLLSGNHINFYHNTFCLDNTTSTSASAQRVMFISGAGTFDIRNNIFSISHSGTGAKHAIYLTSTTSTFTVNNNQYHISSSTGTNTIGNYGNVDFATFAQWQTANSGAFDQNGVNGDPIFVNQSSGNLTPQSSAGNATGANLLTIVPIDFNGTSRTITPDIGAIEFTPVTCLQPLSILGSSFSGGITLNWANDPDADSVHIEYGPSGFNQGTGTMINVTGTTFTATSLFPNQCYDFYITSYCNGLLGNGSGLITLCTPCNAAALPYTESFGSWPPQCFTITGTTTWTWQHLAANGYAVAPFWSNSTGSSTMKTQNVNVNNNAWVKFAWAHQYNTSYPEDQLILRAKAVNSNTWDTLINLFGPGFNSPNSGTTTPPPSATDFIEEQIILNPAIFTNQEVEFELIANTDFGPHVFIDYFTVEQVPQCLPPFNLSVSNATGTSAAINWSSVNGNCFKLEYGPVGFTAGTGQGTVIQNASSPTTISGLTPVTQYDVYIADCCDTTNFAGPFTFNSGCLSGFNGTYTINKNAPVSATNFQSFDAFFDGISVCGVSGPVTVNVVAGSGPYNEQILIESFVGASATNTVTINGNGNRLTFASTNSNQRGTLTLDGAQRLIFNDLEIEGSGTTNCHAVQFTNGASNNTFDDCYIFVDKNLTSSLVNPLVWNDSPTSPTLAATTTYNNNTIKNCVIEGGYYGFIANGPAAGPWSTGNVIENNEIRDFYLYGLWLRGQEGTVVKGNSINRKNRSTLSTFYGLYMVGGMEDVQIIGNRIHDNSTQLTTSTSTAYPVYATGLTGSPTKPILFANNLMYNINSNGLTYGVYILGTSTAWQIYHNTLTLDNTAGASTSAQRVFFSSASSGSFDIRNNIFSCTFGGTGTKHLIYISSTTPSYTINYNQYHFGAGGAASVNHIGYWGTANFTTLANWQTANSNAFEANGLSGNPVFASPLTDNLTPLAPVGNNNAQNLNTIVPNDYNNVARSSTPDRGAIEFTPISADIALTATNLERGVCFSTNDTVQLTIQNVIGSTINFATTPLTAQWSVTGPINSNGTINVNSGTLAAGASTTVQAFNVNMSQPGIYTLNAFILPNANNQFAGNDTLNGFQLEVRPIFEADPKVDTVFNATDSVEITVRSPFLAGGDFFITEICHFKTGNGAPIGGWPTYLLADDYIEITGVPSSDLGGYILEQWNASSLLGTFTFPQGTILSPNGTAIIAVGQLGSSVPSPANFYYHGNGTYTGTFGSTIVAGRILKDASNNIVDAVGYGTYTFPAAAGVTAQDWSGNTPALSSSGNKLNGPDNNTASNWVNSGTSPQDPNVLNANVPLPNPQGTAGFSWSFNGAVIDTNVTIHVGPYANPGVYQYIASYTNSPCGTLYDTVTIHAIFTVPCLAPSNVNTANLACDKTDITWSSDANKLSSKIEYGAPGFTPGSGTTVNGVISPYNLSGLAPGTGYDVYVTDSCAAGSSTAVKISFTTPTGPLPTLSPTSTVTITFTQADVVFNAGSNATNISWDFGDGNSGTGNTPTHTYAANGTYSVVVTATNGCGTTTQTIVVTITGINIEESILAKSLNIFPNPNMGNFRVSFMVEGVKSANINVVNPMGQVVYTYTPGNISGDFKHDIDLSRMAAGVYIVQITTDDGIISRRVTVQK